MDRYAALHEQASHAGQAHLFAFYDELVAQEQAALLEQVSNIDFDLIHRVYQANNAAQAPPGFQPPVLVTRQAIPVKDVRRGEQALRQGNVAILVVAGGQAARLGTLHPKGCLPITPLTKKTLYQLLAEKVRAMNLRYGTSMDLYFMTSATTHEPSRAYFKDHDYFGLDPASIVFFEQAMLPAIDANGKIIMESKGKVFTAPCGHGGVYEALRRAGLYERMARKGVTTLAYVQVDNPLIRIDDPAFIGAHLAADAEMSSKVVEKTNPEERVGIIGQSLGRTVLCEYVHLPQALAHQRNLDGKLTYRAASIAAHLISKDFAKRIDELPYYPAHKKIVCIDGQGRSVTPEQPNAYKLESFVFDALPRARASITLQVDREEEFAPVKNATGEDSPHTARELQILQAKRWLAAAGVDVSGIEVAEISPLLGPSKEDVARRIAPHKELITPAPSVYVS